MRDKDGISAGLAFLTLAAELKAEGRTVADHLDEFVERFGCHASGQVSIRVTDLARIGEVMERLARRPAGLGRRHPGRTHRRPRRRVAARLPPSDVLRIVLEGGARVMVRPSGTEPKLKVYIDAVSEDGTVSERRAAASAVVDALDAGMRELVG